MDGLLPYTYNKNQAVLTLEKRQADEFYMVYDDLEYEVTACGSDLYDYCLNTFHQMGFAIDPDKMYEVQK